jgi:hypothetical protein
MCGIGTYIVIGTGTAVVYARMPDTKKKRKYCIINIKYKEHGLIL